VHTEGPDGEAFVIEARAVVNAAGLAADRIAELAGVDVDALRYRMHPCKGDYF
jgi:L-2-hydroxyglutarate oxidase LhgO